VVVSGFLSAFFVVLRADVFVAFAARFAAGLAVRLRRRLVVFRLRVLGRCGLIER